MRSAPWRGHIKNKVIRDRADLAAALDGAENSTQYGSICGLLEAAEEAAEERATLLSWWNGNPQEYAYRSLHEAEAQIHQLLSGPELVAHANDLLVAASVYLKADDLRLRAVADGDSAAVRLRNPLDPAAVATLARAVNEASDEKYAESRGFRNRLIRLTLISAVAVALVMTALAVGTVPLSAEDTGTSGLRTAMSVSLFGAIGALISAVPPLANAAGTWNPFSLPVYQMLLKIVLGPLFAVVGVILLKAGIIPGTRPSLSLADLLVWSVVFGAAQQAVTRSVDSRVAGLVAGDPADATSGPGETAHGQTGPSDRRGRP
ncbi:hypothetical protein [Parafrankia irregularis]|nr:hypothetical protein [Parafrankia irregularis]MBE3206433.1 hypothetical protein [Parafrankia sp. CH37]